MQKTTQHIKQLQHIANSACKEKRKKKRQHLQPNFVLLLSGHCGIFFYVLKWPHSKQSHEQRPVCYCSGSSFWRSDPHMPHLWRAPPDTCNCTTAQPGPSLFPVRSKWHSGRFYKRLFVNMVAKNNRKRAEYRKKKWCTHGIRPRHIDSSSPVKAEF